MDNIPNITTYIQRVAQQYGNIDVLHEMLNKLYPEYLIQGGSGSFIPSIGNEQIIHIYDKNNEQTYALTMMGRGFLQALQIICNYLLFKPKLMLLDEVDTPFHAGMQKKLFNLLCSWDTQIIWVTHSRSLLEHIIDNKNDTTSLYITKYNPTKQVNTIYSTNADNGLLEIWELLGEVSFELFILSEDTDLLIKKIYENNRVDCKIGFMSFHGGDNRRKLVDQIQTIQSLWKCPIFFRTFLYILPLIRCICFIIVWIRKLSY